jgi:glycosyltransferase involved in cell wall biosynthesis
MIDKQVDRRIAWLLPAMGTGGISFQHILAEFAKSFPDTMTFTGQWPGYAAGFEDTFAVQEVGATRYIEFGKTANGYTIGFSYASPQIVGYLLKFKPQIVFANAFSAWTAIALLLKPIGRWKVIITYEGGSSIYESPSATIRHQARRFMASLADAFVVNSQSGKVYLLDVLKVKPEIVFARPFLVPSVDALLHDAEPLDLEQKFQVTRPVFLFVGQIVPRKGLKTLLEACFILKSKGYSNYTLLVVGDGEQRLELEAYLRDCNLSAQIKWVGKVPYAQLGSYFQQSDVFVFPTYDDIWGMVLTEAMAFGKPVICSKGAGASEMVNHKVNGFVFDPQQVEDLVNLMLQFIDDPKLINLMGIQSQQLMLNHTSEKAIECFTEATNFVSSK